MFEDTSSDNTTPIGVMAKREPQTPAGVSPKQDPQRADGGSHSLQIGNAVSLTYKPEDGADAAHVVLEWQGGSSSDMLADAVIAIVLQV